MRLNPTALLAAAMVTSYTVSATSPATSAPRASPPIVVAAVGDLMLGSTYPYRTARLPPHDGTRLLRLVTPVLRAADIAFGNLEAPLFDGRTKPTCTRSGIAEKHHGRAGATTCWAFRMPSRYGKLLAAAGFDVLSLANNHIGDFGTAGLASTVDVLRGLRIAYTGPTGTVARLTVRGRSVHVIAFAIYGGLNNLDNLESARALVAKSARVADIVVVSFHGGAEGRRAQRVPHGKETFYGESRGALRVFAHAVVDAGADLVVGHGPHVLRGMEFYKRRLIAYSLGTFASYRGINVSGVLGQAMILEVGLAEDGSFVGGRVVPIRQRFPGGPKLDGGTAVVKTLRRLSKRDFGARGVALSRTGKISPP